MSQVTKYALSNSLIQLLEQKPLSKITINDIAENCHINRMTFYYHFEDIYDLLEWTLEVDASKIIKGNKTYSTWQEGYLAILNTLKEKPEFSYNIYHSTNRELLEKYLYKLTFNLLIQVVKEQSKNFLIKDEDKDFIAHFYKYAFVGITLDWINNHMSEKPEELVKKVSKTVTGVFNTSLSNFSLKN